MVTLSADITADMMQWIENRMRGGMYKSRSEIVRELFREKMLSSEAQELQKFRQWEADSEEKKAREQAKYLKSKGLL
ncbi:MAG: hypothetical protein V1493_00590 [Candidatus Diapherotrites archaeon]